jgi:predicted DNA-binding transcriptional regulator AlpA
MDKQLRRSLALPTRRPAQHQAGSQRCDHADDTHRSQQRDKLTIAEVCADLGISRRTFYEWRAKNRAPKCIALPNGSLRIRNSEYQRWLAAREEAA